MVGGFFLSFNKTYTCFLILQAWYAKTPLGKARIKALADSEKAEKGKTKKGKRKN